ncbi:MAG: hypothetical protein JW861_07205 [Bacteroidales bacterium]|nr:hypothetical protein [Bacteroidales bacterium]
MPQRAIAKWAEVLAAILTITLFSCGKKDDGTKADIPNVYVYVTLYPNSLDFINIGGFKYINGHGYRGIILYRNDTYSFSAYERTCTYDPERECARVEVEPSGITAIDSCCMSRFNLIDGSPFDGPATLPLKQYRTDFDGELLIIHN